MAELTYRQAGDYLIPDIQLEETEDRPLGKYGRMRRAYLEENNKLLYNHLTLTGKLFPHLWEVQETASARMGQLMEELPLGNTELAEELDGYIKKSRSKAVNGITLLEKWRDELKNGQTVERL